VYLAPPEKSAGKNLRREVLDYPDMLRAIENLMNIKKNIFCGGDDGGRKS